MSSILVLGAARTHIGVLDQLVAAGFRVLACDRDSNAPGARHAHIFRPIDFSDSEAILAFAREEKIDGIMPINDFGARTAAKVSAALGLPGMDPAKVDAVNDKGLMRDVWAAASLPQPRYFIGTDFDSLAAAASKIGFPCIMKPADSGGGSRGVSIICTPDDLAWAFNLARPFARNGRFIVEDFVEGMEITVETISVPGKQVSVLTMSDQIKFPLRTRVNMSLNYPAQISKADENMVAEIACAAVKALEISAGMAHTEMIIAAGRAVLIETGARGGGGHIFHTLIEASSGISAPVVAARALCGLDVDLPEPRRNGAVYRFFNPPPGILRVVNGLEEAARMPGVLDIDMIKRPGDRVGNLANSLERAGYVVTAGRNREEAVARADAVCRVVRFTVEAQNA